MQGISDSYGAFSEPFETNGQQGLVTLHPEMIPANTGIAPTGRYHVYGIHPQYGTFTLIVDEDENGQWFSEMMPAFIDPEFITWMGGRIENYSK